VMLERYTPEGAPYYVGAVIQLEHAPEQMVVTYEAVGGYKGVYVRSGKSGALSRRCTKISTIVPVEHWSEDAVRAVADHIPSELWSDEACARIAQVRLCEQD